MRKTYLLKALGAFALVVTLLNAPANVNAQRPSLGALQIQINDMLSGDLPFDRLGFGPECFITPDPDLGGLCFSDIRFIFKLPPGVPGQPIVDIPRGTLRFGDECTIGVDPELPGLIESDPGGFRLLGVDNGQGQPSGAVLRFGPTDDCMLGVVPGLTGLVESDPGGLRLLGPNGQGCILTFGPTDLCRLRIDPDPNGPRGLIEEDPFGLRLLGVPNLKGIREGSVLRFGPTDECTIGIDPQLGGIVEYDPVGFRLCGAPGAPVNNGMRILFGPTDECTLGIVPNLTGLVESDPGGLRLLGREGVGCILTFGPTDDCRILVDPTAPGLCVTDPTVLKLLTPLVRADGIVSAEAFETRSSAEFKENVRDIDNALEKVKKLRGVYFDLKKEYQSTYSGTNIGFIAEEVAEVISEATVYDQVTKKPRGVKYANLVSVVVEAVKEQQQQIESQALQIDSQQEQIDAQQSQLDDQQSMIEELQNAVADLRAMQQK